MPVHLNDRRVAALPVPTAQERQRDYWDDALRGFGVRVSYGGKRAFVVRYRALGRLRRLTLGPYPDLPLVEARRRARLALGDVAGGSDPAEEKQVQRDGLRFKDLAKDYLEHAEKWHRRWNEEKRIIDKDLLPVLSWRLLNDIKRREIRALVENIARKRNAPIMANRTLALLSRMFNFALDREWLEASPAARIKEPGKEGSRDRVLNDDELRLLWAELETLAAGDGALRHRQLPTESAKRDPAITPATAEAFQLQVLTAQRPGEVWSMRWTDVDLESGWWLIPGTVAKNGQPHRVPLVRDAVRILKARQASADERSRFVFENRAGAGSVAHRAKKAASILSRSLNFAFRAHDLRRTVATRMAETGVPRDHIARILNHVEGGPAATRVYDRYSYDTEKRAALERWSRKLDAILAGGVAKVLPMPLRAGVQCE
jgi:integrase